MFEYTIQIEYEKKSWWTRRDLNHSIILGLRSDCSV